MARLESVNVGAERGLAGTADRTGIYKEPAANALHIGALGVEGDCIVDADHHGGPDQAVYLYFAEDYAWWFKTLGRELGAGTFGENLTVSGLDTTSLAIGDRLAIGDVLLEITSPRVPCNTLAKRMEDSGFVKTFRDAERSGVYCRVVVEGKVEAGMPVAYRAFEGERVTVLSVFRDWFKLQTLSADNLRRTLAAPLAVRARDKWEASLARAEQSDPA